MENNLYDVDELERLTLEYGMAGSTEAQEDIEEQIIEETVGTIYTDDVTESMNFPSGTALLVALVQLHQEVANSDIREHIEREIKVIRDGVVDVAEFDVQPLPYAAYYDLLAHADRYEGRDDAVSRYFRLRAFKEVGAFDDIGMLRIRASGELTDEERDYIEGL